MCLGAPGRVVETWSEKGTTMANVDFPGNPQTVCLAYVPHVGVGDYVIAHLGYALTQVDPKTADETIAVMRQYGLLDEPVEEAS